VSASLSIFRISRIHRIYSLVADLLFVRPFSQYIDSVDDKTKLWRCYVIWGNQRSVVVLPGLLIAATTGEYHSTRVRINGHTVLH
jgi:hypothetical protein